MGFLLLLIPFGTKKSATLPLAGAALSAIAGSGATVRPRLMQDLPAAPSKKTIQSNQASVAESRGILASTATAKESRTSVTAQAMDKLLFRYGEHRGEWESIITAASEMFEVLAKADVFLRYRGGALEGKWSWNQVDK
ncbi:Protein of unknown function [Pyronema omphalodes CBS 100304]|uniref:Uncharacterized protein n=1 Tax=Pyronema omphalodes (strain CBS 100304) TaxID=1076935 RepID=U4L3Z9_PYROM|nr:Protein of unknown function [Pyronema omphalodes CBS 100304]